MELINGQEWAFMSQSAYAHGVSGDYEKAHMLYDMADQIMLEIDFPITVQHNADLSMMRHKYVEDPPNGLVQMGKMNEDYIVALTWTDDPPESYENIPPVGLPSVLELVEYIERVKDLLSNTYHRRNVKNELQHLQVISPGRSGSVAMYDLFRDTHYVPYHTHVFNPPAVDNIQQMYSLITNQPNNKVILSWVAMRAAEWCGASLAGRPEANFNHLDSVYAPVYAAMHPESRFIWLKRNPVDVFKSFWTKNQWNREQIGPIHADMNDGVFRWHRAHVSKFYEMAWYIRFHEVLAEAMGCALEDRLVTIQAEDLFSGRAAVLLKSFASGITKSVDEIKEHYRVPINEKKHKATTELNEREIDLFINYYSILGGEI